MTKIFHSRSYGRVKEKESKPWRKKLLRTNYDSNLVGSSFSNGDHEEEPKLNIEEKGNPEILKGEVR